MGCNTLCSECLDGSSTNCLKCAPQIYQLDKICYNNFCPPFYLKNSQTYTCDKCQEPCVECEDSVNICKTCIANFYLQRKMCVYDCGDGEYKAVSQIGIRYCADCPTGCDKCTANELSKCTKCTLGGPYYLDTIDNGGCVEPDFCPETSVENPENQECTSCDKLMSDCDTCDAVDVCTKCKNSKYLDTAKHVCVTTCPPKTYGEYTFVCMPCKAGCETCTNSTYDNCTSCYGTYYFDDLN